MTLCIQTILSKVRFIQLSMLTSHLRQLAAISSQTTLFVIEFSLYVSYYNQTILIVNNKNDIFHIFMQILYFLYIFMLFTNFK